MAERRGSPLWSVLFLTVPIFGVGIFLFSVGRYWLPPNISSYGEQIDDLFYVILWITTVAFVVTEVLLVAFLFLYRNRDGKKAQYSHSNRKVEIVWTIVPGLILLYIAFAQKSTWDHIRDPAGFPEPDYVVELMAEQFAWWFTYPGVDGVFGTEEDDVLKQNQLHVPVNENVLVRMRSRDVLHSFFLPHLRVKQDLVPGMTIPVWFKATKTTKEMRRELYDALRPEEKGKTDEELEQLRLEVVRALLLEVEEDDMSPEAERMREDEKALNFDYEIACAELCGFGHYRMRGFLTVETRAEVGAWLKGNIPPKGGTKPPDEDGEEPK